VRALLGALAAGVLPGYFWARFLCPASGLGERLAYSTVLSMASVPPIALLLARIAGSGITLWMAVASVVIVVGSGAVAFSARGPAPGLAGPVLPLPVIRDGRALALIVTALGLALASMLGMPTPGWSPIVIIAALVLAAALAARPATPARPAERTEPLAPAAESWPAARAGPAPEPVSAAGAGPAPEPEPVTRAEPAPEAESTTLPALRGLALTIVLALTAARAYAGPILHDWPHLRGSDQYSYVVMAEQLLSHGSYGSFLVYPPGFSALTAVVSRLTGLSPLALFPAIAPALLAVTALGAYALAARLWGFQGGLAAAALSGLVLVGSYLGLAEGRYPDLISAFFLMVMAVAALITLYQLPSARSGVLLTVIGASVVLYHPVASLYLLLLLAVVALIGLPYLLLRRCRTEARALTLALALLLLLSAAYAWYTYVLGAVLTGGSATSRAVGIALGSQATDGPGHVLDELSPPIIWLGVLGAAALTMGVMRLRRPPQVLAAVTALMWGALMYAGSLTALDGFPRRFERDLGGPLCVLGAFALCMIVHSLARWRPPRWRATAVLAAAASVAAVGAVGLQATRNIQADSLAARIGLLTPQVAAAGRWLRLHNTGGTIISTPGMNNGITNRAVLAMGGYTGLQSYFSRKIAHPRSLPPAGRQPLLDSRQVLLHPASCHAAGVIDRDDVRYVVLYKFGQEVDLAGFRADATRYRRVFENSSVVIYVPSHVPGSACPTAP
jgi:hypothetical protein